MKQVKKTTLLDCLVSCVEQLDIERDSIAYILVESTSKADLIVSLYSIRLVAERLRLAQPTRSSEKKRSY